MDEIEEKTPRLELKPYYHTGFDECKDAIPEQMENAMFFAFYHDRFCDEHTGNRLPRRDNPVKETLAGERLQQMFPSYEPVQELDGYTYESYAAAPFPQLEEREATFAMIFTDGQRVVFSVDNTYKYQEWNELFDEMIGGDTIGKRQGLHRAFLLYTDSSDMLPVWTLYEKTVAGFAVDCDRRTLTAFDPTSAVLIFHALYQLCGAQYSPWFGVTGRTCTEHLHDDSDTASGGDPYVKAFRERLARYQYDYDEGDLLKQIDN